MGKAVKKAAQAFIHGVFRGVASPGDTFIVNVYQYPYESEQEAMRQDWERVGKTLRDSVKQYDARHSA